jgi:hypothetical protein
VVKWNTHFYYTSLLIVLPHELIFIKVVVLKKYLEIKTNLTIKILYSLHFFNTT